MIPITVEDACLLTSIRQMMDSFINDLKVEIGNGCRLVPNLAGCPTIFALVGPQDCLKQFQDQISHL